MLKQIVTTLIILLFIPLLLSAQAEDKYLISVALSQNVNLSTLEKIELSVYHIFKETVIAGASDDKIQSLRRAGISYQVLDENPEINRYFIVSSKTKDTTKLQVDDNIIFDSGESLIIKNYQPEVIRPISRGLIYTEMNKTPHLFKEEKLISQFRTSATLDSVLSEVLIEIDVDSVRYFIQELQDFGTRFLMADTKDSVAAWIQDQFEQMGYTDVVLDVFWNGSTATWQTNVVATITGSKDPQSVYVVGGHHDSYSSGDPMSFAPGADDNASGTTAVLEIARAIMASGYQPEATFKFVTFAAEEYGLYGGYDYAEKAYNAEMNIKLMINHDMISHTYSSVENSTVDINYYTGSEDFRELAKRSVENYTLINPHDGTQNSAGSDSYMFWAYGFPAVYFEEHDFSPYYHSINDVIENYSMGFCAEIIKASCATLISASVMPSAVEEFKIVDMGNGNALQLSWAPNSESDVTGYHIYLGTSSGIYDTTYTTTDTSLLIADLGEETIYYIGITAYDLDTFESTIVEKIGIPRTVPIAPSSVYADPLWHAVDLHWLPNLEYDIAGYNIYRTSDLSESLVKINESIIEDTSYTDYTTENAVFYYYVITAVDDTENESIESNTIKSRHVSLDQGIIVVDETYDGNGLIFNPSDNEVDHFYDSILERFSTYDFDVKTEGSVNLADLGAYSTIIWHSDDYSDINLSLEFRHEIQKYLDFGGNLIYSGYFPSKAFEGNMTHPFDFFSGDFIYDYLKIKHVESIFGSRFYGAIPVESNYPAIYVDSSKTNVSSSYHLRNIEGIEAVKPGTTLYLYDTTFDTSSAQGQMKGQTVGVSYSGDDYKVVTLSFPLYYMQMDQAKDLVQYILNDQFSEIMSVEDSEFPIPTEFSLLPNYPNPFNPTTVISYQLPVISRVELSVYNLLGQRVATLVNTDQQPGQHQVEWDASGFASGVYFYRLQTAEFQDIKKMVLIK
jgi:hypothetical protein